MKLAFLAFLVVVLVLLEPTMARRSSRSKKVSQDADETEVRFTSQEDLESKVNNLQQKKQKQKKGSYDEDLSEDEIAKLKEAEVGLKKKLKKASTTFGEMSHEKAKALHALGGNWFKQGRFNDLLQISKEIVEIHETLDGPEAEITGRALGNVGATAFRLKRARDCEYSMKRALYILLKIYGEDSKEALLHRGRMLTFHVPDAERTVGWSYNEYIDQLENEL